MQVLATSYLPSICYMAKLFQQNEVVIEQHETFPKQTLRNRANIATGNGIQVLPVPVVRPKGNHTPTHEIKISYQEPWNIRHWRAIVTAYNAAPFFLYYRDGLEKIFMRHHDCLIDLNDELLRYLLDKLKFTCEIHYSEDFNSDMIHQNYTSKHYQEGISIPPYSQVFEERIGFQPNLSVIDLLFNLGPEAHDYLKQLASMIDNCQ